MEKYSELEEAIRERLLVEIAVGHGSFSTNDKQELRVLERMESNGEVVSEKAKPIEGDTGNPRIWHTPK